jgi:hypothetical protein
LNFVGLVVASIFIIERGLRAVLRMNAASARRAGIAADLFAGWGHGGSFLAKHSHTVKFF